MPFIGGDWNVLKDCFLCWFNHYGNNRDLKDKKDTLSRKKGELQAVYDEVNGRIERGRQDPVVSRRAVLKNWLGDVRRADIKGRVGSLLQRAEEEEAKQCMGYCCAVNCCSVYCVSSDVVKMTEELQELIDRGKEIKEVTDPPPQPVVERQDMENIVGMESRLNKVWRLVEDKSVRIICLYGVRGVGKTTLLENLNNKFSDTRRKFDLVILVKASSAAVMNIETIHQVMRYRLAIPNEVWDGKNEQGRAAEIKLRLSNRRFALLLDDLRGPIDLKAAGVPIKKGSKIVFTAIMEDACNTMGKQEKFKVDCLPPKDAWDLFQLTVTDDVLNSHRDIPNHALTVAELCGQLPLALVTIGSAMKSCRNPVEWENAINELRNYPAEFPGMGNLIFPRLKFSYDHLSSQTHKTCFLFCSLFLKSQLIRKDELVDLWIGEGILRDSRKITAARVQGKSIIESLIRVCLLEEVEDYFGNFVKMHDMIRDLALWIASQDQDNKILAVKSEDELIREQQSAGSWNTAVRVSLWNHSITSLATPTPSPCPRLLTLLVRHADIKEVPERFFQSKPALRVLEWSWNGHLTKLPVRKGELINLRYLNLSDTRISELPIEIKGCYQLIILLLDGTENLDAIPEGLLSKLSALQVFSRVPTTYIPGFDWHSNFGVDVSLLHELESLKHIQDVSFVLSTRDSVRKLQSSLKLQSCARRLISGRPGSPSKSFMTSTLQDHLQSHFQNLEDLFISNASIKHLTCLVNISRLRFLFANNCPLLEEIIGNDEAGPSTTEENFVHLRQLNLQGLPELKSICGSVMAFHSLESIYVRKCPNLKKLPLNSQSGKKNTVLMGRKEWWDQLTWDDDATKDVFVSKFIPFDATLKPNYTYEASVIQSSLREMDIGRLLNVIDIQPSRRHPQRMRHRVINKMFK